MNADISQLSFIRKTILNPRNIKILIQKNKANENVKYPMDGL